MTARLALIVTASLLFPTAGAAGVCTPNVQWTWDGDLRQPAFPIPCATPLVVQLTDDNGDSRIDTNDLPDVREP